MFGLGTAELFVVFALALIFLGPEKLPEIAKGLGKMFRKVREAVDDLKSNLDV